MKKTLLKFVLLAVVTFAAISARAAVGDKTTKVNIDFSNSIVDNSVAGSVGSMTIGNNSTYPTEISNGILVVGNGTHTASFTPATKNDKDVVSFDLAFGRLTNRTISFYCKDAEGNNVVNFEFRPYDAGVFNTNLGVQLSDMFYTNNTVIWDRKVSFTITLDYKNSKVTTKTVCYKSGAGKSATTSTYEVDLVNSNPIAKFELSTNYDNTERRCQFDNLKIVSEEGAKTIVATQYSLKYYAGSELLKTITKNGYSGDKASLNINEKRSIIKDGQRYVYSSDNASSVTIAADGSSVVNINYVPEIISAISPESLNRNVLVVPKYKNGSSNTWSIISGELVSWRSLAKDAQKPTTVFDVYRDDVLVAENLRTTSYFDAEGSSTNQYVVKVKVNGVVTETSQAVTPWTNIYKSITLNRPAAGSDYDYAPNDCSVGDVDGDGDYEIIVKWDPSNSKDNSQSGVTGNVFLDCYKLDGRQLWRIDLGKNIRAGAHYTQFLVYDFDGNGKAELICKTAPGSMDGEGNYVSSAASDNTIKTTNNNADYRNSSGYILTGPEYLTVFNGETGAAIHTINYCPNRAMEVKNTNSNPSHNGNWGDAYGNRCDRYLATVAYLDGSSSNPSAVMCRGYYTAAYLWAVNFNGSTLSTKWLHESKSGSVANVYGSDLSSSVDATNGLSGNTCGVSTLTSYTAYANGNHNLSVGDVDGDGCDEIIYGACAIDNDGKMLYATGFGHGDAIHLTDIDPDRPGLEVFDVHEETPWGYDLHDAETGEIIVSATASKDTGRGMAADFYVETRGCEFWSTANSTLQYSVNSQVASTGKSVSRMNFRLYWDGDLQDDLFDDSGSSNSGPLVDGAAGRLVSLYGSSTSYTNNGTKSNPCLIADLFGDWREEVVLRGASTATTYDLNIFSTSIPTPYLVTTPMQDHVYRMGIAWQNVAYNQPPHLGYYLPDVASVKVTFDSQGYTSFSSNKNVTMAGMDGVTAYKGTLDGSTIKLYKVTEIPAGQGAILHGEGMADKTVYLPVIYDADKIANNALVGAPDGATVDAKSAYVLSYTESKGEAFYVYGGTSIPAGKAYLPIPTGGAKVLYFAFEDETGVMEVPVADGSLNDGFYYSITGVRVDNPTKGIYIKNGKKVYIK